MEGLKWEHFTENILLYVWKIAIRFHNFKNAPTNYLFLADSHVRFLSAGNLNILSLTGTSIRPAYDFIPPEGRFEVIILFIGENDLFDGFNPSSKTLQQVAQDVITLADSVCERIVSSVLVLGFMYGRS